MEKDHLRELRHDFRRYYHVAYEDVPADEAIDLVLSLPNGARLVARMDPARSWPDWRDALADVQDTMLAAIFATRGIADAPTVPRPRTAIATKNARLKAHEAKRRIAETEWEEV